MDFWSYFRKKEKIQCRTEDLVSCTASKIRIATVAPTRRMSGVSLNRGSSRWKFVPPHFCDLLGTPDAAFSKKASVTDYEKIAFHLFLSNYLLHRRNLYGPTIRHIFPDWTCWELGHFSDNHDNIQSYRSPNIAKYVTFFYLGTIL